MSGSGMRVSDGISANIRKAKANGRKAGKRGLFAAAEFVLGESNDIAPIEEGDFIRGGVASVDSDGNRAAVSYKDTAFPGQAEWLHEDLQINHDNGRQAKFLESAITTNSDRVNRILERALRDGLGVK